MTQHPEGHDQSTRHFPADKPERPVKPSQCRTPKIRESVAPSRRGQFWISGADRGMHARQWVLNHAGEWDGPFAQMRDDHYWPTRQAAEQFIMANADKQAAA